MLSRIKRFGVQAAALIVAASAFAVLGSIPSANAAATKPMDNCEWNISQDGLTVNIRCHYEDQSTRFRIVVITCGAGSCVHKTGPWWLMGEQWNTYTPGGYIQSIDSIAYMP